MTAGARGVSVLAVAALVCALAATSSPGRALAQASSAGISLGVDPFVQQGERLTGEGGSGAGAFGASVAVSADGDTAIVGAPYAHGSAGAAWMFVRSGSTWVQQGPELTGGEENGEGGFATTVALSANGDTAIVGGPYDHADAGAVWVFTRSGSTWVQQGPKLTGAGEPGIGFFGKSVAVSGDGGTALIGGQINDSDAGAAWVFTHAGSTWTQQGGRLDGSGAKGQSKFGASVALSGDGSTALIGGYTDAGHGTAWVFTHTGSRWTQQGPPLNGGGESRGAQFSFAVALSQSGDTALIGAPEQGDGDGAAWVFTRFDSSWAQQGPPLTGGEAGTGGAFGSSVALSGNGNIALVGAPDEHGDAGAALVFKRSSSTWTQQGAPLSGSGEAPGGAFGSSVALSGDAAAALVGGVTPYRFVGAAWAFAGPQASEAEIVEPPTPILSGLSESARTWREGSAPARISAHRKLGAKPPVGTTFSFALNVPARVSLKFTRTVAGRTPHAVLAARMTLSARAGSDELHFEGSTSKHRKLAPGAYTLTMRASAHGKHSAPVAIRFTIV